MTVTETILRQTRDLFPRFRGVQVDISPIEKGGSERKFYRIRAIGGESLVLVKYSKAELENLRYVEIARFLGDHGLRVPKIYFHDPAEGLIWTEDLGERDLWSFRNESWATRGVMYKSALAEISKLHCLLSVDTKAIREDLAAPFDASLYSWERHYFFENCLGRHFGVEERILRELEELPALRGITKRLASYPRVLIHRDFQSQNIILRDKQAYLIDFQGMRPGLAEYDLASLLYDPYVDVSYTERKELLEFYRTTTESAEPIAGETIRLCALQRLMQALGAYGYLGVVRGNRAFLAHIPAALDSLGKVLATIKGVTALREVLAMLPRD